MYCTFRKPFRLEREEVTAMGEKGTAGYDAMKKGLLPTTSSSWEILPTVDGTQIKFLNAYNPQTGQNAVWDDTKQLWTDAKTGQSIGASGLTPTE